MVPQALILDYGNVLSQPPEASICPGASCTLGRFY